MSVSVLDRKMRGLCSHHLDADLDLDPNSRSKSIILDKLGLAGYTRTGRRQILMARFDHDSQDHRVFHFPS